MMATISLALKTQITRLESGQVEISTPRLLLRSAREDDVQDLHEAFSDAEVMRYWYGSPFPSQPIALGKRPLTPPKELATPRPH